METPGDVMNKKLEIDHVICTRKDHNKSNIRHLGESPLDSFLASSG